MEPGVSSWGLSGAAVPLLLAAALESALAAEQPLRGVQCFWMLKPGGMEATMPGITDTGSYYALLPSGGVQVCAWVCIHMCTHAYVHTHACVWQVYMCMGVPYMCVHMYMVHMRV